jgi:hypothetical protein
MLSDSITDGIFRQVAGITGKAFKRTCWHYAGSYIEALIFYAESRYDDVLIEKLEQISLLLQQGQFTEAGRHFRNIKHEMTKKYNK